MALSIRDATFGIAVVGSLIFAFVRLPDFNHETTNQRKYVIEDRATLDAKRAVAMTELHTCYHNAEEIYEQHWANSCRSVNNQKLNECFASNIPENVCRNKFVFNGECELPTYKSERSDSFRDALKAECRTFYTLGMGGDK